MNKTELLQAMSESAGLTKQDTEKALNAFTGVVEAELKKGEKIQLVGFGTFEVAERAARMVRIRKQEERFPFLHVKHLNLKRVRH